WIGSTHIAFQAYYPNSTPGSVSLEDLNKIQLRFLILRYGAYGAGALGLICVLGAFPPISRAPSPRPPQPMRAMLRACAISAVLSGLAVGLPFGDTFLAVPMRYAPGWIFGFFFGRANYAGRARLALFTVASGFISWCAIHVYSDLSSSMSVYSPYRNTVDVLPGLVGGLGLAVASKLVARRALTLGDEARVAIVGSLLGVVFIRLYMIPVWILGPAL